MTGEQMDDLSEARFEVSDCDGGSDVQTYSAASMFAANADDLALVNQLLGMKVGQHIHVGGGAAPCVVIGRVS